ncbi:MAG: MATE family efflux transporter [Flavobacterium sp.]|nr:MAG: MATE family efflux transporter [Flavobacterium sp.]
MGDVLQQKIAQLRGQNRSEEVCATIGSGLIMSAFILIVAIIAGFIFYFLIGKIINKDVSQYSGLQTALLVSIIATGMSLVSFTLSGTNLGLQNAAPVALSSITSNLVFLVTNVLLLYLGFGVMSIAYSNLTRALYINIFNYLALRNVLSRDNLSIEFSRSHLKGFIKIFSFTSVSRIIGGFSASMDMIFLARFVNPALITIFEVNKRPVAMAKDLIGRHSVALMPSISHANGRDDKPGVITIINTQFKYYYYIAIFTSLCFLFNFRDLVDAWTGKGNFAGNEVMYLLILNFFIGLIGYFMANMGYALGDIKMNSFISIFKGVLTGVFFYFFSKYYGVIGVLSVMVAASLFIDFVFFSYRLYQLGYLNGSFIKKVLTDWAIVIPIAAAGGWLLSYLFALVVPEQMVLIGIIINGLSFAVFFAGIVLTLDKEVRNQLRNLVKR